MPIFLDRHHMQSTTAAEVAAAHLKDLEVQERYGVRFLTCGEPIEDSRDLFGATVQRASRLCNAAETDQILASASVSEECGDSGFTDFGCKALKGFQEPVRVFACDWRGERPN